MSRDICIYQEFLTDAHRRQIEAAAGETGFTPHFFTPDQLEEAKACVQHCEVLYAHSPELLRAAPATLKWYCCSFAGVDPYCSDPSIFANPDCLLTNSNVYGVTIAEHVVMVTLMLLRRMPEYEAVVREHRWSNQLTVRSIRDNTFTILGTGNIGINVAERLRGMGAAKIIGLSALKYGDLSNQASKDYIFDIDRFTSFEGDTGPYILYTIVRIKSILNRYREMGGELSGLAFLDPENAPQKELMMQLAGFNAMMENAGQETAPHKVCAYIYDLANAFNKFYHETKIISEEDPGRKGSWIALLILTRDVLETCIGVLGFSAPDRM